MLIYNPAFDIYHCAFRMINLLDNLKENKSVEIERLRIWDFYLLFPDKIYEISLKRDEDDIKELIKNYISKTNNPYTNLSNNRKMFQRIRPYQLNSLKCLASYKIINSDFIETNKVMLVNREPVKDFNDNFSQLSRKEINIVKLLTSHFYLMSLNGLDGLKKRSGLLEYRYDA